MKVLTKSTLLSGLMLAFSITAVFANGLVFHDPFNNNFSETWYPATYENNQLYPSLCGETTCGELVRDEADKFFRFELRTNTVAGVYTDTELREEPHDAPIDGGPWTPTFEHPVILESRVRTGPGHNFDGSGGAVGTLGVGLWNNAAGTSGPHPDYDSIVFSWIDDDFIDLFNVDGFTASTAINLFPVHTARPSTPVDLQNWVNLKIVWSANENGQQSVEYFVDSQSLGNYSLPLPLQGLNVVIWQDNQILDNTFTPQFQVPSFNQHFDVDFVKVNQP